MNSGNSHIFAPFFDAFSIYTRIFFRFCSLFVDALNCTIATFAINFDKMNKIKR